jgi:type IX secretion system PorP/SprF family membrane protein
MKRYVVRILGMVLLMALVSSTAEAQQLHRRTQFIFNTYLVNPAVVGTKTYSPIMASYRNQWTGFDNAPTTYTLSGHTQLPNKIGVGAIAYHDNTGGAISRTGLELTGSYYVDLNNQDAISFGLSGVVSQYKFDNTDLVVFDPNDEALIGGIESHVNFDANFGMLVFGPNYFFGLSIPQLVQTQLKLESNGTPKDNRNARHFYFMGSYKYYITEDIDLQPSALVKFVVASPVQFDVNAKVTYKDMIFAGLTYRHKDAVAFMAGLEWNQFAIGYAYDLTVTDARNFSPHTHEITLGYYIPRKRGGFTDRSLLGPKIISRRRVIK